MNISSKKTTNILIVEDNPKDQSLFRDMLDESRDTIFNLHSATRLIDGLVEVEKNEYNLILLDLFLPESNGLKTLKRFHEHAPKMPIVVLTRLDDEELGVEAVREGAQEYLVKGQIDKIQLQRAVRHALERHQIEEKLKESEDQYRILSEQLQQANLELESFTYSVSHDLRAPLRAITGFAEIINRRHRETLSDDIQHYIDNIIQAGKQMGMLIDDLLDYSRIGKGALKLEKISVTNLLESIKRSLTVRIDENEAIVSVQEDLPDVISNKSLLNQIFSNLITNGITFHKPDVKPRVEITMEVLPKSFVFCVKDNGIGIVKENEEKIFLVFHRVGTAEDYLGTGIGLAIVKKSLDLLHGKVWLESVEGEGSNFYFSLPRESL